MLSSHGREIGTQDALKTASRESSLLFRLERGPGIALQAMQEKKALSSPWRRERLPTPVFLPGEFHGQRSLAGYSPWVPKELDTTEHVHSCCKYFMSETVWLQKTLSVEHKS